MKKLSVAILFFSFAPLNFAQLTPDQKKADFLQLVGSYVRNYGPYELKRDVFGFDLFQIQPWLTQVEQSSSDLDFYDICVKYVASLQDSHDEFTIPSDFDAWLHFNGDIYDGKFLIDFIDTSYLTPDKYQFNIGDQLISVDGVAVADLLKQFAPYAANGASNPVSRARIAAGMITERFQRWNPLAAQIGATATVVIQQQGGTTATYTIPWDISGTAVTNEGPVPSPQGAAAAGMEAGLRGGARRGKQGVPVRRGAKANPWGVWNGPRPARTPDPVPGYLATLRRLQDMRALDSPLVSSGLFPFGSPFPVFNPPAGFQVRLGGDPSDDFVSGTFPVGKFNVGFIRIPTMEPANISHALKQYSGEMAYFEKNTDGLVVDVMANGGGLVCYGQELATYLIPYTFRGAAQQLRATLSWQSEFSSALANAKFEGAPQWVIATYAAYLAEVQKALSQNRGDTGSLPLCGPVFQAYPATDRNGNSLAYTKPILVLTDNFTLSTGELFAMFLQDSERATIFGTRTDGGGGTVVSFGAGAYSEGGTRVTLGLLTRAKPVQTPGYPSLLYYDGVGIFPDIVKDYMTASNLATGGEDFVNAFTDAIAALIQAPPRVH